MTGPIEPRIPLSAADIWPRVQRFLRWLLRRRALWVIVGGWVLLRIITSVCATYVPPNMIGIKQVYFGAQRRHPARRRYGPGLHFVRRGRRAPAPVSRRSAGRRTSATRRARSRSSRARAPSIKIQTSDGYNVQLDVTRAVSHQGSVQGVHRGGARDARSRIGWSIPRADRILRKTLGELNSEEFYQGPQRIEKAQAPRTTSWPTELAPYGIEVDAVLVRRYVYDEQVPAADRGAQDQGPDRLPAPGRGQGGHRAAQARHHRRRGQGQPGDRAVARRAPRCEKLRAQADLYERKRAAEGKLLVELAEAKGTAAREHRAAGRGQREPGRPQDGRRAARA